MSQSAAWNAGEHVAGRYLVRSHLGAGSLGERYLAFDERTSSDVVLRVVRADLLPDEDARRAFHDRLSRSRALQHPGLARLHEVLEHDGLEVTASQHVPGASLAE